MDSDDELRRLSCNTLYSRIKARRPPVCECKGSKGLDKEFWFLNFYISSPGFVQIYRKYRLRNKIERLTYDD